MTSEIKADKWSPASGTAGTIGDSGDTFTLTAGANLTLGGASTTVTIPSGATIVNSGTATGFGDNNTPYFRADLTSNQSISSSTETVLQFNNIPFDSASAWDSTNHKYIIPESGKWFIGHYVRCSGGGNNTISAADVNAWKNTDLLAHSGLTTNTGAPMGIYTGSASGVYNLSQNDEIFIKVYIVAGSARIDGRSDGSFSALSGFKLAE